MVTGITPKICMLCFVLINSILLNLLCVWNCDKFSLVRDAIYVMSAQRPTQPLEKFPWRCLWSSKGPVREAISIDVAGFHWVNIVKILHVCFFLSLPCSDRGSCGGCRHQACERGWIRQPAVCGGLAVLCREPSCRRRGGQHGLFFGLLSAEPGWLTVGIKSIQVNDLLFVLTCFKADFLLQDSKALLCILSYFRLGSSRFHYRIFCLVLF